MRRVSTALEHERRTCVWPCVHVHVCVHYTESALYTFLQCRLCGCILVVVSIVSVCLFIFYWRSYFFCFTPRPDCVRLSPSIGNLLVARSPNYFCQTDGRETQLRPACLCGLTGSTPFTRTCVLLLCLSSLSPLSLHLALSIFLSFTLVLLAFYCLGFCCVFGFVLCCLFLISCWALWVMCLSPLYQIGRAHV